MAFFTVSFYSVADMATHFPTLSSRSD